MDGGAARVGIRGGSPVESGFERCIEGFRGSGLRARQTSRRHFASLHLAQDFFQELGVLARFIQIHVFENDAGGFGLLTMATDTILGQERFLGCSGLSQRQLAARMSVPRTYVSKIENEKATPTLSSLERLARALEVTVPDLLSGGERNRQEEIGELMKDQFIAELLPFVSQLNGMQLSSVLAQVRDLTMRPRRSA